MTTDEVTKNIWRNTISNYICIALRMGTGLLIFRLLYQELGKEEFGFWALLWSLFGYGILLDFGFGFTAMKRAAELSAHEKWDELSRVLSTIFYLYVVIGLLICTIVAVSSGLLVDVLRISGDNREGFRKLLILFFCGMGLSFPFGIFPEILIGLQRICLVNVIFSAAWIANFICVAVGAHFNLGIKWYMIVGLLSGLFPCLVSALYAIRGLPQVRIRPSLFSWGMVRETTRFSVFAYINTVGTMILTRTDQIVLSTALAVSAVALYQAAAKIGEMFAGLSQQLPDTFSPAAAHMNAKGKADFLRSLLVNGTRFSVMIATPVYFICAFYMEGILKIITGDAVPLRETFWTGQVLLLWSYMSLITQTVPRRIFMVCGHERRLMWLTTGEALLNLVLSLGLLMYYKNVVCVAVGSLLATTLFGWFYIWPWAAKEVSMTGFALARVVLIPTWLACLPLLLFVVLSRTTAWLDFRTSTLLFLAQCAVAGAIGAIGLWKHALTEDERATVLMRVSKLFARKGVV